MKKHYRHENDCLNCGTTLEGKFCHNCGQENLQIKESFGHMMNHAIADYFHFDHQFFHTLKPLLFQPGLLTNQYMAGKRVQYLHPVKMYIFISVVYFLILFKSGHEPAKVTDNKAVTTTTKSVLDKASKEIDDDDNISEVDKKEIKKKIGQYGAVSIKKHNGKDSDDDGEANVVFGSHGDTTYAQYVSNQQKLPPNERDGFFSRTLNQKMLTYKEKYGPRAKEVFLDEFKHNIPKMMFILLPIFALILKLTFWRPKKYYVEHLIYAFHLHSFLFLFLAIIMLLQMIIPFGWGLSGWIGFAAAIYIIWYIYRSLRAVYHRGRFRTITKIIGMSFAYLMMVCVCLMILLVITALII